MSRYTAVTEQDLEEMLGAIGVGSLEDLFADIPEGVRLGRDIDLPDGRSEQEVYEHLAALAARNVHADAEVSFLGAGMYDHYVPAIVDSITRRSSSSRDGPTGSSYSVAGSRETASPRPRPVGPTSSRRACRSTRSTMSAAPTNISRSTPRRAPI